MSSTETRPSARGAPLGPGSLLWSIAGDPRGLIPGTAAGLMQLMLPGLGAGVTDHSNFFDDPYDRIFRSIPYIWGSIFAGGRRGRRTGPDDPRLPHRDQGLRRPRPPLPRPRPRDLLVGARHLHVGVLPGPRALLPRPAQPQPQQEQLYAETVTWYRRYGVSDRAVPPTLDDFWARFDQICAHELELTPAVRWVLDPETNPGTGGTAAPSRPALHPRRPRRPLRVRGAQAARVRLPCPTACAGGSTSRGRTATGSSTPRCAPRSRRPTRRSAAARCRTPGPRERHTSTPPARAG